MKPGSAYADHNSIFSFLAIYPDEKIPDWQSASQHATPLELWILKDSPKVVAEALRLQHQSS